MNAPILKNRPALIQHAFSFLASLAIHAVLIYLMAAHFVSVKILDFKEQVTDIIIAPRPKLQAPKIEGPLPELPRGEADLLFGIPSRRRPAQVLSLVEGGRETETGPPEEVPGGPAVEPRFTEGFRLDSQVQAQAPASRDRLRLTVPERQPLASGSKPAFLSSPRAGDLRRYVHRSFPGVSGISGGKGVAKWSRGTPSQVRIVAPSLLQVDLSPWARTAVELIQKNWNVPAPSGPAEVTVEVAIVVLKSGEITAIEIVTPSEDYDFNQAAREAVEMSSPLPALPANFPAASLQLTLIFAKQ